MVTVAENEKLCRIEGEAPMGKMLREYWVPACRSEELEAGGAPKRVKLFGKEFVAFRGENGKAALMDERCPHRKASMALARNEDNCLRCIFHGWKFDMDGNCVDVPNERSERAGFRDNIKYNSYPTRETGRALWVYVGEQETPPAFPNFMFNDVPETHMVNFYGPLNCNWVQGVEPALDNSHATILHTDTNKMYMKGHLKNAQLDRAPLYDVETHPFGIRAAAQRRIPGGGSYVRVIEYILPFYFFVPSEPQGDKLALVIVPVDDETSMQWFFMFNPDQPMSYDEPERQPFDTRSWILGPNHQKLNRNNFREGRTPENVWGQNRENMTGEEGSFAGLYPIAIEDLAIQESQGAIADRSTEFLGIADRAVVQLRLSLLKALKKFEETGTLQGDGLDPGYEGIVGHSYLLKSDDEDWRDYFKPGSGGGESVPEAAE
ncbi:Rieske 2Fe-2S domain-containing protein [Novosphingopyxis sp.]|uniref:Rieske 2Fe-2S domain-containing protein n=1 Tax=Novosphingopyxis sp. TaxID=2709690 RepID=UPI003B5B48B0